MSPNSSSMSRREAIGRIAQAGAGIAAGMSVGLGELFGQAGDGGQRPNIIFILIDDLRWDAMSCMGHPPFLKTPNIDRIANEGDNH